MAKRLQPHIGYEPDLRIGSVLVELKRGVHSFRNVRASLMAMAYHLALDPAARGVVVLADSRITRASLERELDLARQALRPEVFKRLSIVLDIEGRFEGLPKGLGSDFPARLRAARQEPAQQKKAKFSQFVVLSLLLRQWLLKEGPVTTDWLMKASGASYPPVAAALKRYQHILLRHSDRRVELRRFPRDEWAELVAVSERVRSTARFIDRSGIARSPQSMLQRLATLKAANVAAGGITAARHYLPSIDLAGTPRLDISIHTSSLDLAWVKRIDPALELTTRKDEPAALVVHLTERRDPMFVIAKGGLRCVDPVEALLDLHEARLEPQARELLEHFIAGRK
ncbi:MAG: hypothetical protein ABIQ72_11405 [Usitatibacter sp.]